jgi:hypothetical protein
VTTTISGRSLPAGPPFDKLAAEPAAGAPAGVTGSVPSGVPAGPVADGEADAAADVAAGSVTAGVPAGGPAGVLPAGGAAAPPGRLLSCSSLLICARHPCRSSA